MSMKTVGSRSEKVRKRIKSALALTVTAATMMSLTGASLPRYRYHIQEEYNGSVTQLAIAYTDSDSPHTILQGEQIELENGDTYTFTEASHFRQGTITIKRAFPIYVKADGKQNEVMVQGGTVRQALESAFIELSETDIVSLPLDQMVTSGMEITVKRVRTEIITKDREIPFEIDYEESDDIVPYARVEVKEGTPGVETYSYEATYIDGRLTQSKFIGKEVTKDPVNALYHVGSDKNVASDYKVPEDMEFDENGNPLHYKKKVSGKATAYSTKKRTKLIEGCVAMDLSKYPRGSWLYIKSADGSYVYGYAKVADTGTALVNGTVLVDVFFDTFAECYEFGAKQLDVYVLT